MLRFALRGAHSGAVGGSDDSAENSRQGRLFHGTAGSWLQTGGWGRPPRAPPPPFRSPSAAGKSLGSRRSPSKSGLAISKDPGSRRHWSAPIRDRSSSENLNESRVKKETSWQLYGIPSRSGTWRSRTGLRIRPCSPICVLRMDMPPGTWWITTLPGPEVGRGWSPSRFISSPEGAGFPDPWRAESR